MHYVDEIKIYAKRLLKKSNTVVNNFENLSVPICGEVFFAFDLHLDKE